MTRRLLRALAAFGLLAAAYGLWKLRHPWYVLSWHGSGAKGVAPELPTPELPGEAAPLARAQRVRVVLLDGLDRKTAAGLPRLNELCARGGDFEVDVGFPAVSYSVQHALWTGLTQVQSGILWPRGAARPVAATIPSLVPGSVAVAESHAEIVGNLGFASARPAAASTAELDAWRETGFAVAGAGALAGEARLAFVHVLRIDAAGHKHGASSREYRDAALWADQRLGEWLAAERAAHATGTRWLVLADHGQRAVGGHGDAEDEVRVVRACLVDDAPLPALPAHARVHMVDVTRALASSLGVTLDPGARGRELVVAAEHPAARATMPRPGWIDNVIGLALLLAGAAFTASQLRRSLWHAPVWWVVSFGVLFAVHGWPSLSGSMVWSPKGKVMAQAAFFGLPVLAVMASIALVRGQPAWRTVVGQLALPFALAAGAFAQSGGIARLTRGAPPLMPGWSALCSAWMLILAIGAAALALPLLAAAALPASDRSPPAGTSGTAP